MKLSVETFTNSIRRGIAARKRRRAEKLYSTLGWSDDFMDLLGANSGLKQRVQVLERALAARKPELVIGDVRQSYDSFAIVPTKEGPKPYALVCSKGPQTVTYNMEQAPVVVFDQDGNIKVYANGERAAKTSNAPASSPVTAGYANGITSD